MATKLPVLHALDHSQSQKILWLIEELDIPYELELYERNKSGPAQGRAPDSMKKVHPLGKAPQLVTSEGRVLIESTAIAQYLIATYDKAGKFKGDPSTGNDDIRDETLSSFAGSSIATVMLIEFFFDLLARQAPFFIRFLFTGLRSIIQSKYTAAELDNSFKYLNGELGNQDYFMGNNPGRADFMISWPVDFCTQHKYIDMKQYPKLDQWYDRIHARDAWKESLNKGNGYDLTTH